MCGVHVCMVYEYVSERQGTIKARQRWRLWSVRAGRSNERARERESRKEGGTCLGSLPPISNLSYPAPPPPPSVGLVGALSFVEAAAGGPCQVPHLLPISPLSRHKMSVNSRLSSPESAQNAARRPPPKRARARGVRGQKLQRRVSAFSYREGVLALLLERSCIELASKTLALLLAEAPPVGTPFANFCSPLGAPKDSGATKTIFFEKRGHFVPTQHLFPHEMKQRLKQGVHLRAERLGRDQKGPARAYGEHLPHQRSRQS